MGSDVDDAGRCERCNGAGTVPATYLPQEGEPLPGQRMKCPDCGGTGKTVESLERS
jgi:DnaJ-class molecular chaperone